MDTTRKAAGEQHEKNISYQLSRRLPSDTFKIFDNLKLTHDGFSAQIDHLVLHKYGFIIIESKSIHGEVKVNREEEWSRSYKGTWYGIGSPIKQAEQQIEILKSVLQDHAPNLLGRLLGMQKGFRGRQYDILIAISSSAMFDRESAPTHINDRVIKTEFLADSIKSIPGKYAFYKVDSSPWFSEKEMSAITEFLAPMCHQDDSNAELSEEPDNKEQHKVSEENCEILLKCKSCGGVEGLMGAYGKFGYYIKCPCGTNTSMKIPCPSCAAKDTKVSKLKTQYTLSCKSCTKEVCLGDFPAVETNS
ncbi:NERD domain-containing protein [Spongiibacter sp. KMU-158]|uniref:NERD domain-containing protein n=1 Tax=Spongiibacter pelagi TaxID=2760804 RepID=A0A927C1D7_9GAMM|nr:nuclease-related domain-containing protein [Spongiibacter pelagi]MBD2859484.1 NERD domain-containing protein [Spongiibacter pelagi]